jgi:methylthioribose-1-phosphate isomerase
MVSEIHTIEWVDDHIVIFDQTKLPNSEEYLSIKTVSELIAAIQSLAVRGAPALGVAGAYGVVVVLDQAKRENWDEKKIHEEIDRVRSARPTAVNLAWGVAQVEGHVAQGRNAVLNAAKKLAAEDYAANRVMAKLAADWLLEKLGNKQLTILTHCNTGSLATTGWGTALGVVRELHARGKIKEVFADETRPLLQGSRLTAWELKHEGIPFRLLPDGAAATAIVNGLVDAALIGADRVVANGDTANKIGSLGVALACDAANIPFLVIAPESTVDRNTKSGRDIHIEMRKDEEVTHLAGVQIAPIGTKTFNPAFDVTPYKYISALVTEKRVYDYKDGQRP